MSLKLRLSKLESVHGTTENIELIRIANDRHRASLMTAEESYSRLETLLKNTNDDSHKIKPKQLKPERLLPGVKITKGDRKTYGMSDDDLKTELEEILNRYLV